MANEAQLVDALQKADAAGDTASAQQFAQMIKAQRAGQASGNVENAPPGTPAERAFAQGQNEGAQQGPIESAVNQAANSVLLGQGDRVMGALRYAGQRLTGVENPDSYETDRAYAGGKFSGSIEAHPVAGTLGGVAGAIMGGGLLAKGLKAAESIPVIGKGVAAVNDALTPATRDASGTPLRAGTAFGNVARSAAANAAVGGGTALASGQGPEQAAQTAGISAVAGPTVGKVMEFSLSKLLPASQRAMTTLAQTLGETPKTLESAYDSFMKLTGRTPSVAELAGLKSQGAIKTLAKSNATIGNAAVTAARAGTQPLHVQMQQFANSTRPQTEAAVQDFRDTMMDRNMSEPHPQTGIPLRDTPVNDPNGVLSAPHIAYALQPNTAINARLGQSSPVMDRILTGSTTLGDVETIRKALRDQQNSLMRPAPGSNNSRDPMLAKEFADVANKVEQLGTNADPDYAKVLGQYRQLSRYGQGLAHGLSGSAIHDIDPGDTQLGAALKSTTGIAGYEHGNALYTANQALKAVSPGSVQPQASFGPEHATQAAMAASSGGVGAVYHMMRAIPGLHLPENAQKIVAQQLFDPAMSKQAIANLRRGHATDDQIRKLGAAIGGVASANIAKYLSQGQ